MPGLYPFSYRLFTLPTGQDKTVLSCPRRRCEQAIKQLFIYAVFWKVKSSSNFSGTLRDDDRRHFEFYQKCYFGPTVTRMVSTYLFYSKAVSGTVYR